MSVTLNGTSGLVFGDGTTQGTAAGMPFRNRIINGDMRIDQRNAGAAVTWTSANNGNYLVDRWKIRSGINGGTTATLTAQQSTLAPSGFNRSFGITVNTARTPVSGDRFAIEQAIEGLNVADLSWGTANAKTITVSFWVRSSLTGTFSVAISNFSRAYPATYTITAANTWEYKTITIPGDTSGSWVVDNTTGFVVSFDIGEGSDVRTTPNIWSSGTFLGATGSVNVVATAGATFNVTGVQLEKAAAATVFEFRPIQTELAMCQRYCYVNTGGTNTRVGVSGNVGGTSSFPTIYLPVSLRASPSVTVDAASNFVVEQLNGGAISCTSISVNAWSNNSLTVHAVASSAPTFPVNLLTANSSAKFIVSAEL